MSKNIFEPVKLLWNDEEYEVASNRVMGLIQRIEDHVTFADLQLENPKIGKISVAYAEVLRYAGAEVKDDEVYQAMFHGATGAQIQNAITGLLVIMIPPQHLQKKTPGGKTKKSSNRKRSRKKTKAS